MNDKQFSKFIGAICDAHRNNGCIASKCPLAVYQCYGYRSPIEMYNQLNPFARQNIRKIVDEHYWRYIANGKGIEREFVNTESEVGTNVESKD